MNTPASSDKMQHWDEVYSRRAPSEVSWYESRPIHSLAAIEAAGLAPDAPIIDIGGGASTLVDELLERGHRDVTVLDISERVLAQLAHRVQSAAQVRFIREDITRFRASRPYALWHDRAVFHFLTEGSDREAYRAALLAGTEVGSHIVIATFGPQGPERCSGLSTARYDAPALASAIGEEFRLISSTIDEHLTPGGARQQFLHTHFLREKAL